MGIYSGTQLPLRGQRWNYSVLTEQNAPASRLTSYKTVIIIILYKAPKAPPRI